MSPKEKKQPGIEAVAELLAPKISEEQLKQLSFEKGMMLLEQLVEEVESGELSLENTMIAHERGMLLSQHLRTLLEGAEKKLKIIHSEEGKE